MSYYASFQGRVYLGERNSNGEPINVRSPGNVADLSLEMLDSLRHAHLLVAHEVAHLAHAQAAGPTWDGLVTLADGLFLEGLAVCASAHLVPHQTASTYLWAGISATPTGESLDAWLGRWRNMRTVQMREAGRSTVAGLAAVSCWPSCRPSQNV